MIGLFALEPWLLRTICTTGAAVVVIACVLWKIHQRQLREKYAVIWLVFGMVLFILGLFPKVIMYLAAWTGIFYLSLVMGFFFLFLFVFILQVSVINSTHSDSVCKLTQRAAMAKEEVESLKKEIKELRTQIEGKVSGGEQSKEKAPK